MRRLLLLPLVAVLVACEGAGAKAPATPQPSFSIPYSIVLAPSGTLFIADGGAGRILRYDPVHKRASVYARGIREPAGLERAPDGTLFVTDVARDRVLRVDRRGGTTVLARIEAPAGLALRGTTLYVSSIAGFIWRVDVTTRAVTRVAGDGTPESTGDGGPALDAHVESPHGIALDAEGNLYLEAGTAIRRIDAASGTITTFHRDAGSPAAFAPDGTLYYGQGDPRFGGAVKRRAPDGLVTTLVSGTNLLPTDVLLTRDGRALLFGQSRPYPAIRRFDLQTGRITTVLRGRR